ncbi:MAG: DUF4442 domain-containing protein [Comamonadaceae bacterium]|nr:MAG: DUF4442 domain-containing protein [Comamonadaceae bacterium]
MSGHVPNRLERQLEEIADVPAFARNWYRSVVLRRAVPFARTAGLDFLQMDCDRVEIGIRNERKVRNHIGGIHASAMNLLAETATGMVVGMNVRDDCIPLAKEMKMVFTKGATGSLKAVATLTAEQRALIRDTDKGEIMVPVVVTDEAGINPVECEFVWAWVPFSPKPA